MEAVVFDFAMVLKRPSQQWFDRLASYGLGFEDLRPLSNLNTVGEDDRKTLGIVMTTTNKRRGTISARL